MKLRALAKLERQIVIGMIIDSDFVTYVDQVLDTRWTQTSEARILMTWVLDYFHKYHKAPAKKIQTIYEEKLDSGKIQDAQAEVIEEILQDMSMEAQDWDPDDVVFLKDQVIKYGEHCRLLGISEALEACVDSGDILEGQKTISEYRPIEIIESKAVEPLATEKQIDNIFADRKKSLIKYPGDLGRVLNPHMVRQGFVIYLAQNKGGKSFHLMDAGIRGAKQGYKVFIVQAGDMSQIQLERRIAIYLTQISDQEKYCGPILVPVIDCIKNQLGTCEMDFRKGGQDEGPFEDKDSNFLRNEITFKEFRKVFHNNPDHIPCQECRRSIKTINNFQGAVWYKKRARVNPLDKASYISIREQQLKKFYTPFHALKNIRLSTYSSESLNCNRLNMELDILKDSEGWEPDIIVNDYLDLNGPDKDTAHLSSRDQENKKWQRCRRISQDRDLLFLSASQSDADGFTKKLLDKSNFSEDRRKLDHCTSMLGLNMSIDEKMMGLMRVNEIVSRETEGTAIVHVLHRLQMGQPILGSYF